MNLGHLPLKQGKADQAREKGRDLTQSYDKKPYTHIKIQKPTWQHKHANKNFVYTTIAERLRTVNCSNNSQSLV